MTEDTNAVDSTTLVRTSDWEAELDCSDTTALLAAEDATVVESTRLA